MDESPAPITIVSGLPRSGTSLMMQMLDAGGIPVLTDKIRTADSDNPKGYWEFEPVKTLKQSQAWLSDAPGKAVKMVHLLLLDLPRAGFSYRVIFMQRNIKEVLASQGVMLQRQGKSGAALNEETLGAIFQKQMERVKNYMKENPQFSVLNVNYNELLSDPSSVGSQINSFFGGNLNVEKMLSVIDPSLYRQKKSNP